MEHLKPLLNIAEIFAKKGITHFVLSPGSRCAPMALALLRHPALTCITVTDERSAAFIAMGMAQQKKVPVVLLCTSGTAILNYYPAITEAFYQKIPLIVLTSDRPPEWIDQFDNQSIRQREVYGKHVLASYELPSNLEHKDQQWHTYRILSEAINISTKPTKGPVHINIPLREPIYPEFANEEFKYDKEVKVIEVEPVEATLSKNSLEKLLLTWNSYKRKLVLAGMNDKNILLSKSLLKLQKKEKCVVISDITSNINESSFINYSDIILSTKDTATREELAPELLVTFGGAIVSKATKNFLKELKPKEHWHIQPSGLIGDTFQSLTKIINVEPECFFQLLESNLTNLKANYDYSSSWSYFEEKAKNTLKEFLLTQPFGEFLAINEIIKFLPANSLLQLGNSMPIRYANYLSLFEAEINIKVNSNRGTSGIDGSLSTALGAALTTNKIVTVILGDLSFFYDRNALWNNYLPNNLRIIVLNNHGGGIFRILDGSSRLDELDTYFETKNTYNAKNTALDAGLEYTFCDNQEALLNSLNAFFDKAEKAKLLEIESDSKLNTEIFNNFKKEIQFNQK